ncbi:MAG: hypothetical protein U0992_07290 [Planctomycetaceae bacterium]
MVLLLGGYVSAYLAVEFLKGRAGVIPGQGDLFAFAPLQQYQHSDLPGSITFAAVSVWCRNGGQVPFDETSENVRKNSIGREWQW